MSHVSDPTLVFAHHQRVGVAGCTCGWSTSRWQSTHAEHLVDALTEAGFAIVDAAHLLEAVRSLGYRVSQPDVTVRIGGVTEVAAQCGVSKSRASMWMTRAERFNFPKPYAAVASGNLYDLDEVAKWHELYTATRRHESTVVTQNGA